MKNNECKRRQYKFEINEVDLNFGPLLLSLEGGPGGTVSDAWDDVCGAASDLRDDVCGAASDLWESTCDFFEDPWSAITDPFGSCFDFLENTWASLVDFCEDTWEDIEEAFEDAWESVEEFCSDAWDTICDVWDDWGQQIIGIVAVVVCSWIPGVNAVVAAAVIGALQAGMESGWDLQAMAVGAAAGAISAYAGGIKTPGLSGTMAKVGCNAASGALKSGYASGWDLSEMGQGALTGGVAGYVSGNGKLDCFDSSSVAGKLGNNIIKNTAQSCAQNGFNEDALINGAASGVGSTVGGMAADGLDIENETMDGFVQSSISSATSQAIVAGAKGEDIGDAVTNSVKQAAVGAAMSYVANAVNDELSKHEEDLDSSEIGKIGRNVITSTIDSCAKNGLNSDALVNGIANGVGNSLGEMAADEMGSENKLAQNFVSSAVSSAASQALIAGATGGDVMLAVTNSLKNTTVKTAMKAMSDKLNSELSEHEADEKISEYCKVATDSVTAAVLSSINGGDFGATFEASLKANINKAIISDAKSIMNAKVAAYEENQFSTNRLTSDVVSFTQSHSQEAFVAYVQATFGEDISDEAAAALYEDIKDGDLKMPEVKVSDEGLYGAEASYNRVTDTIQISSDLVDSAQTNPMDAWKARIAVNEEIGHFLDDQLRNNYSNIGSQPGHVDAVGDEGARFARNVLSAASDEQLSQPLTITKEDGTAVKIDTDSALRDDALGLYASDARIAHEDFSLDSNYEHFDFRSAYEKVVDFIDPKHQSLQAYAYDFSDALEESGDYFWDLAKDSRQQGDYFSMAYYGAEASLRYVGSAIIPSNDIELMDQMTLAGTAGPIVNDTLSYMSTGTKNIYNKIFSNSGDEVLDTALSLGDNVITGPRQYSTAFEMQLEPADFGRSRSVHFNRANASLDEALQADSEFAQIMDDLIPDVENTVSNTGGRQNPAGWTWEHASTSTSNGREGVMRLVPTEQHTPGSQWWRTLHPDAGASGGYSEWAIPAGAPKN